MRAQRALVYVVAETPVPLEATWAKTLEGPWRVEADGVGMTVIGQTGALVDVAADDAIALIAFAARALEGTGLIVAEGGIGTVVES